MRVLNKSCVANILVLETKRVGWIRGTHQTNGQNFITRLTKAIWYLDPHLDKMHLRGCHLPKIFCDLQTYQHNDVFNKFYHTSHHKKSSLAQDELLHLAHSIELSLGEPWAINDIWKDIASEILELPSMMRKYCDHLQKTNNNMKLLHQSNTPARTPSENCTMCSIAPCLAKELDKIYEPLYQVLLNTLPYEYIDLNLFAPQDPLKKFNYIKNLRISLHIGLYRYESD